MGSRDFKVWLQERSLWIPRLILLLTTNSILFLGYVVIRELPLGGVVAIIGIVGNILYSLYFASFAKTIDKLQKRIEELIPIEYRKRTLVGRWGFVPVVIFCEALWIASALYSFWGWFQKPGALSSTDWDQLIEILKSIAAPLGAILGAFIGSYLAGHWAEKRRNRREHFDRLKKFVFEPWASELPHSFANLEHPIQSPYGSPLTVPSHEVPAELHILFGCVKNHFPEVFQEWKDIKQNLSKYYEACLAFANNLKEMLQIASSGLRYGG